MSEGSNRKIFKMFTKHLEFVIQLVECPEKGYKITKTQQNVLGSKYFRPLSLLLSQFHFMLYITESIKITGIQAKHYLRT